MIQKAAHENANIIFGAVMDDAMKESVKITVIAAGFRDVAAKKAHGKPSYVPKTWKATREPQQPQPQQQQPVNVAPQQTNVVQQVSRNVNEVMHDVPSDDLDVPTFLRRAAQKA